MIAKLLPTAFVRTVALSSLLFVAHEAAAVIVHSANFESGLPGGYSGAGSVIGTEGFSAHGFGGSYLRNDAGGNPASSTILTLAALPTHSALSLTFDVAILDSWDGNAGGPIGPDLFNVKINGVVVFSESFTNLAYTHGFTQSYAGPAIVSSALPGSVNLAQNSGWRDSAYNISLSVASATPIATIEWYASGAGWQAGIDESWAVDNVKVEVDAVDSVPDGGSTLALMGLALAGLGLGLRKSRSSSRR